MTRWEYLSHTVEDGSLNLLLKSKGQEGWEAWAIVRLTGSNYEVFFKRPVQPTYSIRKGKPHG